MSTIDLNLLKNIQHLPLPELIRRTRVKDVLAAQCSRPTEAVRAVIEWRNSAALWAAILDAQASGYGVAGAIQLNWYFYARYRENNGTLFEVTNETNEMLQAVRIEDNMPCSLLTMPYDDIYLQLASSGADALCHHDFGTGAAYLEGAYLSTFNVNFSGEGDAEPYLMEIGFKPEAKNPCLDIGLVWRISDKPEDLPIVTPAILPLIDGEKKLPEALRLLRNHASDYVMRPIGHIAKILLYINSPSCLLEECNEYSKLESRLQSVKTRKRAKLESRLSRSTNRIIVGLRRSEENDPHTGPSTKGEKAPHWRRRHPQLVWYGPGKRQAKFMIIEPIFVRKERLLGKVAPNKDYTVK